jgi:hypothetical protein
MKKIFQAIVIVALLWIVPFSPRAQQIVAAGNAATGAKGATARYVYHFENERFTTPVQELVIDASGKGEYRFKRKDQDEIVLNVILSPSLMGQISSLFDEMNFLGSREEYQHKKDFSHLGTITITAARGEKERTVKFNYTENQSLARLIEIFRNVATQETRMFELETIRANDPISVPAQLRLLEGELKGKRIAEPERFNAVLEELKLDESIPLIARNHSERILQMIKKGK